MTRLPLLVRVAGHYVVVGLAVFAAAELAAFAVLTWIDERKT